MLISGHDFIEDLSCMFISGQLIKNTQKKPLYFGTRGPELPFYNAPFNLTHTTTCGAVKKF
jgi:hypothetical protein